MTLNLSLSLPTGTEGTTGGAVGDKVPPTLLATGTSAFTAGGRVQLTQHLHRKVALVIPLGLQMPLQRTPSGLIGGPLGSYGLSILTFPDKAITLSAGISGRVLGQTTEADDDKLTNSGGHFLNAEVSGGYRFNKVLSLGLSAQLPIYRKVNGQQVTESLTIMSLLGYTFGDVEQDHEHRDCDHHDHGHDDAHKHGHDDHGHNDDAHKHGHNDDAHKHGHDDHGHASSSGHSDQSRGDFSDAAKDGKSFELKDALVKGKITVIDFWAEWCPPCKDISRYLQKIARQYPQLAVRKVEIPDFNCAAAKEHLAGRTGLPVVRIYSEEGELLHDLFGIESWQLEPILEPLLTQTSTTP